MTSRLDRLFILLETGSSNVTRQAAANQIGEVQRLYPHELHNLLNRLISYLHHPSWDTRISAAQAVGAILKNVPKWDPKPSAIKTELKTEDSTNESSDLAFDSFDLVRVLQKGARLMGSEGTEFDFQDEECNKGDRLMQQRAMLNEKLGFTVGSKLGMDCSDIVSLDDMVHRNSYDVNKQMLPVQDILKFERSMSQDNNGHNLSSREINRAKRKARQQVSASSSSSLSRNNSTTDLSFEEPEKKKSKAEEGKKFEIFYDLNEPAPESLESWADAYYWPLQKFCTALYGDLFNSKWEVRHGAATALREVINLHSCGAGKCLNMTEEEMKNAHSRWIEDATLRFLCVLSLDRFGDFVSDQVVAPVRETCAQVLGIVLKEMCPENVNEAVKILLSLIKQTEWEVRHGGLLGLKYALVVREDLLQTLLPFTINDILLGLFDSVDDVGAVAAATLIPVTSWFPKLLTPPQVSSIVKMLWDLLLDQDELTSACNSFMGLLASILNLPNASQWIQMEAMSILIPRLWPFLSHSTSSVRRSTLQTLKTLTQSTAEKTDDNKLLSSSNGNGSLHQSFNENQNLQLNFGVKFWQPQLLQEALRHIYQRVLVEPIDDIQELSKTVWVNLVTNAELSALLHAACPFVASWICLSMQPARLAFDPSNLIAAKPLQGRERRNRIADELASASASSLQRVYLGGNEGTPAEIRKQNVTKARINAARMLGLLSHYLVQPAPGVVYTAETESPIDCYTKVLLGYLQSRSSLQRLVCGMIISFWALSDPGMCPGPPVLQEKLKYCVMEYVYYDEVAISFTRLLQEAKDFLATLKQYKVPVTEFDNQQILTLNQIQLVATTMTENLKQKCQLKLKTLEMLEDRRRCLQNSFHHTSAEQNSHNISTQASLAGAIVCMRCLPEKLNPVIKPLMESIKKEECQLLQKLSAEYLAHLLDQVWNREPSPNCKIVNNLCVLLKSDVDFTPKIIFPEKPFTEYKSSDHKSSPYYGIVTLTQQQKSYETNTPRQGAGRPSTSDATAEDVAEGKDPSRKLNRIQRIGATFAINTICKHFGTSLNEKVPVIWTIIFENVEKYLQLYPSMESLRSQLIDQERTNDLMTSLQLIEIAVPNLHSSLHEDVYKLLPKLCVLLTHPLSAVRHMVGRCFATLAYVNDTKVMHFIVENIIPYVQQIENTVNRQGAVETINLIVEKLQFKVVPYVVLLIVPLLGRMSDQDEAVRLMSSHCFATLIQLMPLDSKSNGSTKLSKDLLERKTSHSEFLEYLFLPKTIPDYKVPVPIDAELRSYQQAGVNWLWFLNKYNLHGILCDDMGLGKTLQTICILAGDHYQRAVDKLTPLPSIVVCPPTLSGHWLYEVAKFVSSKHLTPLCYVGLPSLREKLRGTVGPSTLVITSYDIVRKEIDFFSSINWNYCVLDEGHVIKNGKTKASKAIKQLKANHRLILSGTPIQNNVLELWSLFDFLMPGFLGTEKQFTNKFSRPILTSRDPKSSSKEQEAGVLAMEALHRQVLPFLLRRVKEDVLRDLPPKITQDLLCELSPLQERLYEDFSKTHLKSEIQDCIENLSNDGTNKKGHIFQALRYLQKVCNHPKLVLNQHHPEFIKIKNELGQRGKNLDDIEHAAKLPLLKQLLLDCGIGAEDVPVNQHRALIFCQLRSMLDIVENDLLKKHLPSVTYLRLDGNVHASMRHSLVTKFNHDPSIDVLLLTTQVGGLGLNLTGADTVIFVEHDWNPMKDIQAMDRAHRIGQKKVVNVYRLITRKSLEEKIMGLQKFKIATANTIVSSDNASLETMRTDQLLDLFDLGENANDKYKNPNDRGNQSMKSIIDSLPDLWEEKQYDDEYDLNQFVQSLKK